MDNDLVDNAVVAVRLGFVCVSCVMRRGEPRGEPDSVGLDFSEHAGEQQGLISSRIPGDASDARGQMPSFHVYRQRLLATDV